MSNIVEKYVDKTYVINIERRKDRKENAINNLKKIGYDNYEFFNAYCKESTNVPKEYIEKIGVGGFVMSGWFGYTFSHYGVIDLAKRSNYKAVMIFEDDVVFKDNFNDVCASAFQQLEGVSWDWLQFGGNHQFFGGQDIPKEEPLDGLYKFSENLSRIIRMLTTHAYLIKNTVYDFILNNSLQSSKSMDNFYANEVYKRFNCYCVRPGVATQLPGFNDIGECYSDYTRYID